MEPLSMAIHPVERADLKHARIRKAMDEAVAREPEPEHAFSSGMIGQIDGGATWNESGELAPTKRKPGRPPKAK